jgi:hypothetical protein
MIDVASDLTERFDFAVLWFLERYEVMPDEETATDLSDEDAKAVEVLKALHDSVDAIPPPLIKATEELRDSNPELFEKTLVHGVQVVGFGFSPNSATEFVEVLNRTVQRDTYRSIGSLIDGHHSDSKHPRASRASTGIAPPDQRARVRESQVSVGVATQGNAWQAWRSVARPLLGNAWQGNLAQSSRQGGHLGGSRFSESILKFRIRNPQRGPLRKSYVVKSRNSLA